jgi:tubulin beta
MGTEFQEMLCDEHGIGGDGEYCGDDNDALLDRINVFYYEAGRNLVNHTFGQKWA